MVSPGLTVVSQLRLKGLEKQIHKVAPHATVIYIDGDETVSDQLRADVLLTLGLGTKNLRDLLRPQHGIEWIHAFGTGVDGFPVDLISQQRLSCSRGATAVAIAEWVMAMLLSDSKCLPDSWVSEPPAQWIYAPLESLAGKKLALIGFGATGKAVANRALAFDMNIRAMVRSARTSPMTGVRLVGNWSELVADADVLVIAAPATRETYHLLNRETLMAIKPGLHVVNVARGSLIDQSALREALDDGRIARASLDVVDPEPLPQGHWLYQHPGVRLSPHIAWNSPQAFANMLAVFIENIICYQSGEVLKGTVDFEKKY